MGDRSNFGRPGTRTKYAYDDLNRVASIAYSLNGTTDQTLSFTYDQGTDGIGHLTGVSDANHSMSFGYDPLGEMTAMSQTVGTVTRSVSYGYTNGDLTSITTPSGQTITYGYNSNHQITSIAVNGTTVLSNASYEPLGPVDGWTWGNGSASTRAFNGDGLITGISNPGNQQGLTYDDASRISGNTNTAASNFTYGYDPLDRMTSAKSSSLTEDWTYDANGNRLTETGSAPSTYSISSTSNQITGITGTLTRTYAHDAAGNMLGDTTNTASYNDAGRLKTLTAGTTTTTFTYNALGEMISAKASATTLYVYDQAQHLLGEYSGTGTLIQETVWLGDIPVATLRPNGASVAIYYVETDQLDTPRAVIAASNNAFRWTWYARPFGNIAPAIDPKNLGNLTYDLRFPGQIAGAWGGTFQNDNRDYDPTTGRYIESDPVGLMGGSYSTYPYAGADPIWNSDPSGLLFGINAGEGYGDSAAQYWADQQAQTGNSLYAIPGMFAALWTPCTSDDTFSVLAMAAGASSLFKAAGREWSHALPDRWFRPSSSEYKPWLPQWLNGPLNGNYRSALEHAMNDPWRARFFGKEFMEERMNPFLQRVWNRLPDWLKGAGLAGADQAAKCGCSK